MKHIALLLFVVLTAFTACQKEDEPLRKNNIMIRGQQTLLKSGNQNHLTPQQIAKQTLMMEGQYDYEAWVASGIPYPRNEAWTGSGFDPAQRDTVNGILIQWSSAILNDAYNSIEPSFLCSKNIVLERYLGEGTYYNTPEKRKFLDTIAYIPNSSLAEARTLILDAYDKQDWQAIYDVFNDKFKFVPITGAEYKELKKQGLN